MGFFFNDNKINTYTARILKKKVQRHSLKKMPSCHFTLFFMFHPLKYQLNLKNL